MDNTVDRAARDTAAQVFRNFISGRLSNDAFEDAEPETHDPAIRAVWHTSWIFYDDLQEHHLVGKYRLSSDQRRDCVRWILFLHSDHPYEWPWIDLPGADPASRINKSFLGRLFSCCHGLSEEAATAFLSAGHYPVWPFIRRADYRKSLSTPRLLSSSKVTHVS